MVEPGSVQTQSYTEPAVPTPRTELPRTAETAASLHAEHGMVAVRRATDRLSEIVAAMDDVSAHGASLLPGWTRGHVLSHLARSADGMVNLLTWAKTGVEHPMYASQVDRDADIEEGAHRMFQLLHEDLAAANQRFFAAADELPEAAWEATVTNRLGPMEAAVIPWARLTEVLVHLVDLDLGLSMAEVIDLAGEQVGQMLDYVVWTRADELVLHLTAELPDGQVRAWSMGDGDRPVVRGSAAVVLAWLTGRSDGGELVGAVPELPNWL